MAWQLGWPEGDAGMSSSVRASSSTLLLLCSGYTAGQWLRDQAALYFTFFVLVFIVACKLFSAFVNSAAKGFINLKSGSLSLRS
jgi:hypothetical protein